MVGFKRRKTSELPSGWKASYAPRSKQSPYDGGVRTPILIRWPGKVGTGRKTRWPQVFDILPTILAACNIKVPNSLPGKNLIPITFDESTNINRALFGEGYAHDIADINRPRYLAAIQVDHQR